jgi:Zn finger protein HypA/HybF involved in hydrogenase expression
MNLVMRLATVRAPARLADFQWACDDAGEQRVSYRIACPCGGESATIVSEYVVSELSSEIYFWADPYVFGCAACGFSAIFFDSSKDGYDPVLNGVGTHKQRTTDELVRCPSCESEKHRLLASYSYQFEDEEVEQWWSEEERAQMPDVFDAVGFELTCSQCGETQWLGEFECA